MVSSIPEGYSTVTPCFMFKDSLKAIEFYKKAFGAKLMDIFPNPNGSGTMHATIQVGNSILMLGDENPGQHCKSAETLGCSPISFFVYVPDVDAVFRQAIDSGAIETMPISEQFWGDRAGSMKDPFGYSWMIATHTRDLSQEAIRKEGDAFFAQMKNKEHTK